MPELGFQYELLRSDRRTLSIKISRDAKVLVYAPRRMSLKHIEDFLFEKRGWVLENLAKAQERKATSDSFVPGGETGLLLFGREYPLTVVKSRRAGFDGGSFFVPDGLSPIETAAVLKEVYRSIAKDYLVKRTHELADSFGETVTSVKINSARTRWGSCTSKRNINLSLFLVMAPEGAVDYCMIHELSHLKHMDHSAAFWRLVASRCPDYEERREELKALNSRLMREKW